MPTLYEIGADIAALNELLFEMDGDVTDADAEAAIDTWLQENDYALETKLDTYCALIHEREAIAEARNQEARRLLALAQIDTNQTTRMRERLKRFFDLYAIGKVETPRFKLTLAKNGGKAPLLIRDEWRRDPASAPEQFHKHSITLDTDAIRTALENQEAVEGCAIGERGTHLRIR